MTDDAERRIHEFETRPRVTEFAPKRVRQDRQPQQHVVERPPVDPDSLIPPPPPASDQIAENAARYFTMVANLQEERNRLLQTKGDLLARIEQYESTLAEVRRQRDEAIRVKDNVMQHITRLRAMFENVGGLVADALKEGLSD